MEREGVVVGGRAYDIRGRREGVARALSVRWVS